jgi:hypothetical protein
VPRYAFNFLLGNGSYLHLDGPDLVAAAKSRILDIGGVLPYVPSRAIVGGSAVVCLFVPLHHLFHFWLLDEG